MNKKSEPLITFKIVKDKIIFCKGNVYFALTKDQLSALKAIIDNITYDTHGFLNQLGESNE